MIKKHLSHLKSLILYWEVLTVGVSLGMEMILTDAHWVRLAPLLPGHEGVSGGRGNRYFVEAVLWLARNGARWRASPAAYSNWHTTYTRFQR